MVLLLILLAILHSTAGEPAHWSPQAVRCTQPLNQQELLLREAIKNQFWVGRVEFVGNETTRDNILRRRIYLQEGDVFTQRNLSRSIANVNKLRIIYPVTRRDVIVRLDRTNKLIDFAFCFRERHRDRS